MFYIINAFMYHYKTGFVSSAANPEDNYEVLAAPPSVQNI